MSLSGLSPNDQSKIQKKYGGVQVKVVIHALEKKMEKREAQRQENRTFSVPILRKGVIGAERGETYSIILGRSIHVE